jgi:hypothetical protein
VLLNHGEIFTIIFTKIRKWIVEFGLEIFFSFKTSFHPYYSPKILEILTETLNKSAFTKLHQLPVYKG